MLLDNNMTSYISYNPNLFFILCFQNVLELFDGLSNTNLPKLVLEKQSAESSESAE